MKDQDISWSTYTDHWDRQNGNCEIVTQNGIELLTPCEDRTYKNKMKRPICTFGMNSNSCFTLSSQKFESSSLVLY